MKKALITGITGQDGSYLTEFLIQKGYKVHGIIRRSSSFNTGRIDHLYRDPHVNNRKMILHYGDLTDSSNLSRMIENVAPDEIYNLGAQSHVKVSFEVPEYTAEVDALGTLRLLDAIREVGIKTKFYQASTSELYGKVVEIPQTEATPFYPRSPYGVAKLYAFWIVKNYREAYNLFACNGILFNHEEKLFLGNLNAQRDWGYAPDYIEGMWQMLQQQEADDYLLATGETHSVREFVELAFKEVGVELFWQGKNETEQGIDQTTGKALVEVDPNYYRPTEVDILIGNPEKAKQKLGWQPRTNFYELVRIMMNADAEKVRKRGF